MTRINCESAAACQRLAQEQAAAVETALPIIVGVIVGFIILQFGWRVHKEGQNI